MSELKISESQKIVSEVKEYQGQKAVDLRTYVTSAKYTGPTKKGLWIPLEHWAAFKTLVNSIEIPEVKS